MPFSFTDSPLEQSILQLLSNRRPTAPPAITMPPDPAQKIFENKMKTMAEKRAADDLLQRQLAAEKEKLEMKQDVKREEEEIAAERLQKGVDNYTKLTQMFSKSKGKEPSQIQRIQMAAQAGLPKEWATALGKYDTRGDVEYQEWEDANRKYWGFTGVDAEGKPVRMPISSSPKNVQTPKDMVDTRQKQWDFLKGQYEDYVDKSSVPLEIYDEYEKETRPNPNVTKQLVQAAQNGDQWAQMAVDTSEKMARLGGHNKTDDNYQIALDAAMKKYRTLPKEIVEDMVGEAFRRGDVDMSGLVGGETGQGGVEGNTLRRPIPSPEKPPESPVEKQAQAASKKTTEQKKTPGREEEVQGNTLRRSMPSPSKEEPGKQTITVGQALNVALKSLANSPADKKKLPALQREVKKHAIGKQIDIDSLLKALQVVGLTKEGMGKILQVLTGAQKAQPQANKQFLKKPIPFNR